MDDTARSQAALSEAAGCMPDSGDDRIERMATQVAYAVASRKYAPDELAMFFIAFGRAIAADALDANARALARVAALCDEIDAINGRGRELEYTRTIRTAMAGAEHASADAAVREE